MSMSVNQMVGWVATEDIDSSQGIGESKQFTQERVGTLSNPGNITYHNGSCRRAVAKLTPFSQTNGKDGNLMKEKVKS